MDKIFNIAAGFLAKVEGARVQHWEQLVGKVAHVVEMGPGQNTVITAARVNEHGGVYRLDVVVTRES